MIGTQMGIDEVMNRQFADADALLLGQETDERGDVTRQGESRSTPDAARSRPRRRVLALALPRGSGSGNAVVRWRNDPRTLEEAVRFGADEEATAGLERLADHLVSDEARSGGDC